MKQSKRKAKRLFTVLLIIAMIFSAMPQKVSLVYADSETSDLVLGSEVLKTNAGNDGSARLWYAGRKWIVMGYDRTGPMRLRRKGAVTVWQESVFEKTVYNTDLTQNSYDGSILQSVVNSLLYGGSRQIFSEKEQAAIMPRDIDHPDISQVSLWPLAFNELAGLKDSQKITGEGNDYWLRQGQISGSGYGAASYIPGEGGLPDQTGVTQKKYARPLFDLSIDAIMFTSKADGGKKSGDIGANALTQVGTSQGTYWKVTLKDDSYGVSVTSSEITLTGVKVVYEVEQYGTDDYISAILVNEEGKITYYGRVAKPTAASGTLEINVKEKFTSTDKLYIFNEQYSGNEATDFAGELVEVPLPECVKLTVHWSSIDGNDILSPIVIEGAMQGSTIGEVLNQGGYQTNAALFTKEGYRAMKRFVPESMTQYSSYADIVTASIDPDHTVMDADTVLYYPMVKLISAAEITVEAPLCGMETATSKPSSPWEDQTNPPVITVPDSVNYQPDTSDGTNSAWWIDPSTNRGYSGSFIGGKDYQFGFALIADYGYYFAVDEGNITINGATFLRKTSLSTETYLEAIAKVTAEHDWQEATCTEPQTCSSCDKTKGNINPDAHSWGAASYEWSDDNLTMKASRICQNDGSHKEEETVDVEIEIITQATEDTPGEKKYTATCKNPAFETQSKTLEYELVLHKVTFDTNGADSGNIDALDVEHEMKAEKPTDPSRNGYDFEGWYVDDGTFTTEWDFEKDRILSDVDLIARYSYTVTFEGSDDPIDPVKVYDDQKDERIKEPETEPVKDGYVFDGWVKEDGTPFDFENEEATPGLVLRALYHRYAYSGNEQTWYLKDTGDLPFRFVRYEYTDSEIESGKDLKKLFEDSDKQLLLDGTLLATSQYSYENGSLLVKLHSSCLNALSLGEHTLTVQFADGEASAVFLVKKKNSTEPSKPDFVFPNTGIE